MKMKKEQLTRKQVEAMSDKIIRIGYCEMQGLLRCKTRKGYTAGVYGWSADIFNIDGVVIVTGYRPFGNIQPDHELVKEYEKKAGEIIQYTYEYGKIEQKLDELLKAFIKEVTAQWT